MIISKYTKKALTLIPLLLLFTTSQAYSSEKDHDQYKDESAKHEESKTNEDHQEEKGFKLSAKAIKLMQIETVPIKAQRPIEFSIPNSALVRYGEKYGVYKFDGEHFELINLTNIKKKKSVFTSKTEFLKAGDLIAVKGVPLLRVAHLQASGQGGEGHGH